VTRSQEATIEELRRELRQRNAQLAGMKLEASKSPQTKVQMLLQLAQEKAAVLEKRVVIMEKGAQELENLLERAALRSQQDAAAMAEVRAPPPLPLLLLLLAPAALHELIIPHLA